MASHPLSPIRPELTADRALIERLFSRENVDRLKPQLILQVVSDRLDILLQEGQQQPIDLVEKFALRVPTDVSRPLFRQAGLQFYH